MWLSLFLIGIIPLDHLNVDGYHHSAHEFDISIAWYQVWLLTRHDPPARNELLGIQPWRLRFLLAPVVELAGQDSTLKRPGLGSNEKNPGSSWGLICTSQNNSRWVFLKKIEQMWLRWSNHFYCSLMDTWFSFEQPNSTGRTQDC